MSKGFLSSIFQPRADSTLNLTDPKPWRDAGLLGLSRSGVSVSPAQSISYSAVLACVRVISETLASLPLITYEQQGRLKQRAKTFPLYSVLHDAPNERLTSFELRELLQIHLIMWGNAYCEIEYNGQGQVTALWPLLPWQMQAGKTLSGELAYRYTPPEGSAKTLPAFRVWHIRGLTFDGIMGLALTDLGREAIGLGIAAQDYGSTFFGNGARPGGILEHPGVLGDDAHDNLRKSWNAAHGGLDKANRIAILEEGLKYVQTGVPPEAAQFLGTRKYQRSEIAGILRVPPHMIGDLEFATFSNIEHQQISFVVDTMRPWLVRWEQSIQFHLMSSADRQRYFVEFLIEGLLRGDTASRYSAYAIGIQWGWMSANEVRELENLNPRDGGDNYLTPLNMTATPNQGKQAELEPHYRLLAIESASRLVRREVRAITKILEKEGDTSQEKRLIDEFYVQHALLLVTALCMPPLKARQYCDLHMGFINLFGLEAVRGWEETEPERLAEMAMGGDNEI